MNNVSFSKQTSVYFSKIARISIREKVWKFIVFAAIIAFIVASVTSEDMFETFEKTKSGFFTLASACIWLGIFNSIQSICKEHDIIRSEYRQGMKLSSYITANVLWQAVLCLIQSIIIFVICIAFGFFENSPSDGVMLPALVEYFITVFLLTFGSAVLGIMVSSISGNPTTAMTIMPFVLILQLIMSGVLFDLSGASEAIANITYSKWGMSAFGSTGDMNSLEYTIEQAFSDNPAMAEMLAESFDPVEAYESEVGNVLGSWAACLLITAVSAVVSVLGLKLKNRDS